VDEVLFGGLAQGGIARVQVEEDDIVVRTVKSNGPPSEAGTGEQDFSGSDGETSERSDNSGQSEDRSGRPDEGSNDDTGSGSDNGASEGADGQHEKRVAGAEAEVDPHE